MKYIDADKLRKLLANRYEEITVPVLTDEGGLESFYRRSEIHNILKIVDSLQQEQFTEDLNAEIEMQWDSFNKHIVKYDDESEDVVWLNWNSFVDVASNFYKLGRNSK